MRLSWNLTGTACGVFVFCTMAAGQTPPKPLAIHVLEFDTTITGENRTVARDIAEAIETAFSRRRVFRLLERKILNDLVRQNKMERDLQAVKAGQPPSKEFQQQFSGADGFVRGELKSGLDGVVLTVSLIKLNSEKLWQGQRRHSLYEWLSGDIRDREAQALAAEAAAAVAPESPAPSAGDDGVRGLEAAQKGNCDTAVPLLQVAVAVE
jgi:hypothetical protein